MTLRIGLLGAARITPRAIVEPAAVRDDVRLTAVAARDPARARAFAEAHAVGAVAADYAALIRRDDVDLVYNALPASEHRRWTVAALEAGKAVLCEKPFALDAAEARAMADAAGRTGGLLMEAYHYRHHRVMHDAVALTTGGSLGQPLRAEAMFDVPIARAEGELRWTLALGGGALMDLGCYPLHALRMLLGTEPVVERASAVFEGGVDASLEADLSFAGAPATIRCSMTAERPAARLAVEFERGRLEIVNFIAPQAGCRFRVTEGDNAQEQPVDGATTYAAQLDHVLRVWRGEAAPLLTPADAVAQMRAIDSLYAAAGRPRRPAP